MEIVAGSKDSGEKRKSSSSGGGPRMFWCSVYGKTYTNAELM
jgi:hypothetical protein